jgi:hypothetical protein
VGQHYSGANIYNPRREFGLKISLMIERPPHAQPGASNAGRIRRELAEIFLCVAFRLRTSGRF